jgi:predicted nucleotidyltransferase
VSGISERRTETPEAAAGSPTSAHTRAVTLEVATRSFLTLRPVSTPDQHSYEAISRLGELGRAIERRRAPDPYPRPTGPAPSLEALIRRRDDIMRTAARHGARTVSVFGSVVRGDAGPQSDVDLLVDTGGPQSLFEQAALQSELEDFLGCPVHVLTIVGLSYAREKTRTQINREAISL